ncbi:hypothetical protein DFH07DRAFT_784945 [Mycena maculata]|uniref:Uncharacterized protein n=1 Tax=Mycena maculata TaxID=230809 RepID=A0AAD7HE70_9AGAR|nr:hypothetical protein DFH07DRAFT_784945 [Mycena maculata]
MASVFIAREALSSNKVMKSIYYCLGCDNAALQRDFPVTWEAFRTGTAPSAEVIVAGTTPAPALCSKKRKIEDPAHGREPVPGITTELLSQAESSQMGAQRTLNSSCPSYPVPDRSSFIGYNLVKEAENAMVKLKALLAVFIHLTLSIDGWSSCRNDKIYTVHVMTPTRMSYMVSGIILTGISTASKTIFENLKQIMKLNSAITTFFWHSNYGKKHLRDKLEQQDDRRGLVSFGATRFSTFANQASSASHCLTAMGNCFGEGLINSIRKP